MCKVYGYCRVSTPKQNIERQIRNIKANYDTAIIVQEVYTGTKTDGRKEWNKLAKTINTNDTIVFDSVSRMSRNATEGFQIYKEMYNKGINLVFLKEHHIDTSVYKKALESSIAMTGSSVDFILEGINKYLMALAEEQIKLAFEQAEKEVSDLHQRTKEGIETARINGKQIGRAMGTKIETKKAIEMKLKIKKMAKDFGGNMTDKEVIETLKLARNTYFKYKKQLKES